MGNEVIKMLKKDGAQLLFLEVGILIVPIQKLIETILKSTLSKQMSALVVIASCVSLGLFSACRLIQGDNTKRENILDIICIVIAISVSILISVLFLI